MPMNYLFVGTNDMAAAMRFHDQLFGQSVVKRARTFKLRRRDI